MRLTAEGSNKLIELHNTENGLLQPLDAPANAGFIAELQSAALARLGELLDEGLVLLALEVSRHLPNAHGWPSVDGALTLLQRRATAAVSNAAQQHGTSTSTAPHLTSALTNAPPPFLPGGMLAMVCDSVLCGGV